MPRAIRADQLAEVLPAGGLTLVSACSAESDLLADAVEASCGSFGAMTFAGIFVGGLNRRTWRAGPESRVLTFFQTPALKGEGERVEFLPLCYQDVLAELRQRKPRAAIFMCSPPDAYGQCSFGTEVAFTAELWRSTAVRIAHINPEMPRTPGDPGIPFSELSAYVERSQPLKGVEAGLPDPVAQAIAAHVALFVPDGATLQTGLGKVPDAVLQAIGDRREIRIHTGLIGDGAITLLDSGAMAAGRSATVGVAVGSSALYGALDHPHLQFRPVSVTHNPAVLAQIPHLITINSAIEVDLFGQAYAELTPKGFVSGPGGASDFARGARGHGLRIVALPSSARGISRIVAPGEAAGPVSLGRMDTDVIATEYGAADLRGLGYDARAEALIAIAAPESRGELTHKWADYKKRF